MIVESAIIVASVLFTIIFVAFIPSIYKAIKELEK